MLGIIRSLIFIAIAGAVFFLYTNPVYKKTAILKGEGDTYEQAIQNSKQFEEARDMITTRYQSFTKNDLERLKMLLPDTVDNVRLVIDIEKMTKDSGLIFKKVTYDAKESIKAKVVSQNTIQSGVPKENPQTAAPQQVRLGSVVTDDNKPYGVFNVNFTVQGPYEQFIQFLKTLENSLRIVDITSVSFTSVEANEKDPKKVSIAKNVYEYTISIRTYWLKD